MMAAVVKMREYGLKAAIARLVVHHGYRHPEPDIQKYLCWILAERVMAAAKSEWQWGSLPFEKGGWFSTDTLFEYALEITGNASNRKWPEEKGGYDPIRPYCDCIVNWVRKHDEGGA
jgi:hypothetical protein